MLINKWIEIKSSGRGYEILPMNASNEDKSRDFIDIANDYYSYGCRVTQAAELARTPEGKTVSQATIGSMLVPYNDIKIPGYQQPTPLITLVANAFQARGWEVRWK